MNWIGGHSVISSNYYQISYFGGHDEAPVFNIVFRVLTPIVYLVLAAAVLYSLGLRVYGEQIYLVVVYQILLRWGYNIIYGRRLLLRWRLQFSIAAVTVLLSYLVLSRNYFSSDPPSSRFG